MAKFTVACVQMRSGVDIERNADDAARLVDQAVAQGARLVVTPEMTNILETRREAVLAKARREPDDAVVRCCSELTRKYGIWLVAGSVALRADGERLVNRSLVFGPDGAVAAHYDKIHMFDVDLPDGETFRESRTYRPGARVVTADTACGRLGLSICYDLRFPQLYRALAKAGAELITIPAAFTCQTGEAHWDVLLRARAIETGAFVLAPAQGGAHESGRRTYGHSLIVGPWGEVLAEAEGDEPGIVLARIDLAEIARARTRIPALRHDRPFSRAAENREHAKLAS